MSAFSEWLKARYVVGFGLPVIVEQYEEDMEAAWNHGMKRGLTRAAEICRTRELRGPPDPVAADCARAIEAEREGGKS